MSEGRHAIVLAGGASRRMGTRKEWLDMNGEPNLLRQCRQLRLVAEEVTVATDARQDYPFLPPEVGVARDRVPDRGPVGGICAGMARSAAPLQLIAGCDYPLVPLRAWMRLAERLEADPAIDAIIPRALGKEHPLCGIYRRRTLPIWEDALARGELRVMAAVRRINAVFWIPEGEEEKGYVNMNAPEDYKDVKERLK
ncbi:molybdenum cofactor guanylyltransferase [Cohnella nanjingensis]|uniref:Probable molybdenum cofactor guanylyltransferase n=1 Tax=Cohnella nanjingensis TaxID=1387779 RepID=A0A7X0RP34_9BACL|nr:molybdenum cofactor guanylyltransferase [Cohnella nanjingensis]MBB6669795.1 molybdenum cofactor guanylyltransferase [Cohnella nanjingensis]